MLSRRNLPAAGSSPSQRPARTRRKWPLENRRTFPRHPAGLGVNSRIATVPLAGGTPDTLWESAAGQPSGVVLGSAALYWLISSPAPQGAIWGVTLPGGKPAALVTGLNSPHQLAVDATNLYWTTPGEGQVSVTPLAGGTPLTLASGLSSPGAIAVDDAVYVATASSIVRVPK